MFGGVGEHVGHGLEPLSFRDGEPAGGQQRPDLPHRAGDRGAAGAVQLGQQSVRELEPQVNQGDDDRVGERQVVIGASAGRADTLVAAAPEQA